MAFALQLASGSRATYADLGMLDAFACPRCRVVTSGAVTRSARRGMRPTSRSLFRGAGFVDDHSNQEHRVPQPAVGARCFSRRAGGRTLRSCQRTPSPPILSSRDRGTRAWRSSDFICKEVMDHYVTTSDGWRVQAPLFAPGGWRRLGAGFAMTTGARRSRVSASGRIVRLPACNRDTARAIARFRRR